MNEIFPPEEHIVHRIFSHRVLVTIILVLVIAITTYLFFLFKTDTVPKEIILRVEKLDTIRTVAQRLLDEDIIKHRVFFYFSYYVFGRQTPLEPGGYKVSNTMRVRDMIFTLESPSQSKFIEIPVRATKEQIAKVIADALNWEALDRQYFTNTYAGMQWQKYQGHIEEYFRLQNKWDDQKTHAFLTLSALYYENSYDFLKNMYVPGLYEISLDASRAQVAGILIDQFSKNNPNDKVALEKYIDKKISQNVVALIDDQMILMPDIVAIPPQDVTLKKVGNRTYLLFTASYWNKGRGALEFVADPETKNVAGTFERDIFQRIYQLDGNYTEKISGKFLWHSPHLHYHFQDFAIYSLEGVSARGAATDPLRSFKSTFCVRDSEPTDLSHPGAIKSASYRVCGKERQGISPGWADSYYYTYVDQKFDVTDLPKGTYTLKIIINPLDRFEEITKDNNVGEVSLDLDIAQNTVKVVAEKNYGI